MPTTSTLIRDRLIRCGRGDRQAREELFELTQGRLKAIVRRTLRGGFSPLRDGMDSDDGIQELCLRLLERWERVLPPSDGPADPVPLFFAAAARAIRDVLCEALRGKYGRGTQPRPRQVALEAPDPSDGPQAAGYDPADSTHHPEDLAVWAEVHQFFAALPDPLRQVAELRWYLDLTHDDVGEVLGIAAVTARKYWAEVRVRVRHRFPELTYDWSA